MLEGLQKPIKCYGLDWFELVAGPDWLPGAGKCWGVRGILDDHYSLCDMEPNSVHLWFSHSA